MAPETLHIFLYPELHACKFLKVYTSLCIGPVAAADGHCEAVPEATGGHAATGAECAQSGHPGE